MAKNQYPHDTTPAFGERLAERCVGFFGTWRFLAIQAVLTGAWMTLNLRPGALDAYPYVFLNLLFSVQAAFTGPLILLAQSRQTRQEAQYQKEVLRLLHLHTCQLSYLEEVRGKGSDHLIH